MHYATVSTGMLSPAIGDSVQLLGSMWNADLAAGLASGALQCAYLLQLFHGMGLPPRKILAVTLLCCLIRLYAVPSLMLLICWAA